MPRLLFRYKNNFHAIQSDTSEQHLQSEQLK
jgi:hypothetical protein